MMIISQSFYIMWLVLDMDVCVWWGEVVRAGEFQSLFGDRGERVQYSNSLVDAAFTQSSGAYMKALVPSPRLQEPEEAVWGISWVAHSTDCYVGVLDVQDEGEWGTNGVNGYQWCLERARYGCQGSWSLQRK